MLGFSEQVFPRTLGLSSKCLIHGRCAKLLGEDVDFYGCRAPWTFTNQMSVGTCDAEVLSWERSLLRLSGSMDVVQMCYENLGACGVKLVCLSYPSGPRDV